MRASSSGVIVVFIVQPSSEIVCVRLHVKVPVATKIEQNSFPHTLTATCQSFVHGGFDCVIRFRSGHNALCPGNTLTDMAYGQTADFYDYGGDNSGVKKVDWPRNAVDRYVLAALEDRDLRPMPEADRAMDEPMASSASTVSRGGP